MLLLFLCSPCFLTSTVWAKKKENDSLLFLLWWWYLIHSHLFLLQVIHTNTRHSQTHALFSRERIKTNLFPPFYLFIYILGKHLCFFGTVIFTSSLGNFLQSRWSISKCLKSCVVRMSLFALYLCILSFLIFALISLLVLKRNESWEKETGDARERERESRCQEKCRWHLLSSMSCVCVRRPPSSFLIQNSSQRGMITFKQEEGKEQECCFCCWSFDWQERLMIHN